MLINIQEKRMFIEIFGEDPLDSNLMRRHVKGSAAEQSNRPSIGLSSEAFGAGYGGRQINDLGQGNYRQPMSEEASKFNGKPNESDYNFDHNTGQDGNANSEFNIHDRKHPKLEANDRSDRKSHKKKTKKHSEKDSKNRHKTNHSGVFASMLGSRPAKPFSFNLK
jgi:hypothetical protein